MCVLEEHRNQKRDNLLTLAATDLKLKKIAMRACGRGRISHTRSLESTMKNTIERIISVPGLSLISRSSKKWAVGLFLSSLTVAVVAHARVESIGDSSSAFQAVGPAGLKIEGAGKGVVASEHDGTIRVEVPLSGMTTGISMRDEHMKKAIHAEKYPKAILEVSRSALKFPEDGQTLEAKVQGSFTINGTTTLLPFEYQVTRTGSDFHVVGKSVIDITKFKIEIPCYLGVCVDKDVKIKAQFKVREL